MPGRRRSLLAVLASVALLGATLAGARAYVLPRQRLAPHDTTTDTGISSAVVGEHMTVFLGGFHARGRDPVHVRSVRITGVPRGLRIVAIRAIQGGNLSAGAQNGNLVHEQREGYDFRPVTEMVFHPGEEPRGHEPWNLAIVVEAVAQGDWRTTGLDIEWKAGWLRGTTHYKHTLSMTVP